MNKQTIIVFLATLTLACASQAEDSSEIASNAGQPSIYMWDIDVSVDCAAMSTNPGRCVQNGDRFIAVDRNGSGSNPDVLILLRDEGKLQYAYQASISLIMDSGAVHQIEIDFLDHVGRENNPIQKKFTVSNLPGGAGNENELKACLDRLSELDSGSKIAYSKRVESCSRENSVHWQIQVESSGSRPSNMGPPDDGQGTGTGGN